MSERILVTGGAGYVGSIVVDELLGRGYGVACIDALAARERSLAPPSWGTRIRVRPRRRPGRGGTRAALEGVDAVVHLAAIVGDPACSREPELGASRKSRRDQARCSTTPRLRASSASCSPPRAATTAGSTATRSRPRSSRWHADLSLRRDEGRRRARRACPGSGLIRHVLPSPRDRLRHFAADALRPDGERVHARGALERELLVFGEQFWRPYVHVRDAAQAIVLALDAPSEIVSGEVFNVGDTGENYRKLDLVEMLKQRFPEGHGRVRAQGRGPAGLPRQLREDAGALGFEARAVGRATGIDEIHGAAPKRPARRPVRSGLPKLTPVRQNATRGAGRRGCPVTSVAEFQMRIGRKSLRSRRRRTGAPAARVHGGRRGLVPVVRRLRRADHRARRPQRRPDPRGARRVRRQRHVLRAGQGGGDVPATRQLARRARATRCSRTGTATGRCSR